MPTIGVASAGGNVIQREVNTDGGKYKIGTDSPPEHCFASALGLGSISAAGLLFGRLLPERPRILCFA